jgi:hypothetical protein
MKHNELFANMSPELGTRILTYLREEQREAYKQVIAGLASKRKLRPVFIQRKPTAQQIEWLNSTLKLPMSAEIGEQVLTLFLMHGRKDMLEQFLNDLEIENEDGTVEDLPESLDEDKARTAVDNLFEKFADDEVALYLYMFQLQTAEGYPTLAKILDSDPRCNFGKTDG